MTAADLLRSMEQEDPDEDENPWAKTGAEKYILVIDEVDGRRTATRHPLALNQQIASGQLARASDRAIDDFRKDLVHELHRRAGTLHELGDWELPQRVPAPTE